jgi:hypothetical protein
MNSKLLRLLVSSDDKFQEIFAGGNFPYDVIIAHCFILAYFLPYYICFLPYYLSFGKVS